MAVWNQKEIRIVFATSELVKNDLAENRLSLCEFSLLVFDEADRAVKDYAYTSIARYYVQQSSSLLLNASNSETSSFACNSLSHKGIFTSFMILPKITSFRFVCTLSSI